MANMGSFVTGLSRAEEVAELRKQRREELQMKKEQWDVEKKRREITNRNLELEQQATSFELKELKKKAIQRDIFNAFDNKSMVQFNSILKEHPSVGGTLGGAVKVSYLNSANFQGPDLQDLKLKAKAKGMEEPVVLHMPDGSTQVKDFKMYKDMNGYSAYRAQKDYELDKQKYERMKLAQDLKDLRSGKTRQVTPSQAQFVQDITNLKIKQAQGEELTQAEKIELKQKEDYLKSKATPGAIKVKEQEKADIASVLKEAEVESIDQVDYNKLTGNNKIEFDLMAEEDGKKIKEDAIAFVSVAEAADKLNSDNLASATGIVDATVKGALDRMGVDLDDKTLKQSANYNIIVNSLIRSAFGTQVTGNELERMKAQMGTEFRADKTVRIKLAETMENLAKKISVYRTKAPAYYAKEMRGRVERLQSIADYLRNPDATEKQTSAPSKGAIVDGYEFLGGNPADKANWRKK